MISAAGHVEYSPLTKEAKLTDLLMEGVRVDYVHAAATAKSEKKMAAQTAEAAKQLNNHPEWLLRIDHAKVLNSEWGFVNMAVKPDYRVYMTDVNMGLENFSNQFSEGTAYLKVTGKFMGSGLTQVECDLSAGDRFSRFRSSGQDGENKDAVDERFVEVVWKFRCGG